MKIILPIALFGNYLSFSFLVGYILLRFVPESKKPTIHTPKKCLVLSVVGIIVFSFFPILNILYVFGVNMDKIHLFYTIISELAIGKAWVVTLFLGLFLLISIVKEWTKYLQGLLLLSLIVTSGISSHAASLFFWSGLTFQSIHLLMVSLWVGVLLHVSWFSKDDSNWSSFLRWFTPFAITCVTILFITGFMLMKFVVEPKDYMKSWLISYGAMLVLKHISIIPVLFFALFNGFLTKKIKIVSAFNPISWLKTETILIFFTFFFTSVMSTTAPASHNIDITVKRDGLPFVFHFFHRNVSTFPIDFHFDPNFVSSIFILTSFYLLYEVFSSFRKNNRKFAVIQSLGFILLLYIGMMLSVSI